MDFESLKGKFRETVDKLRTSFQEHSGLDLPLLPSNNESKREETSERSTLDVYTDIEFRNQLIEEEKKILDNLKEQEILQDQDRKYAELLAKSNETNYTTDQLIEKLTDEEMALFESINDNTIKHEILAQKRLSLLSNQPTEEVDVEKCLFRVKIPENINFGDIFKVFVPNEDKEEKEIYLLVPKGKKSGDFIKVNEDNNILTKGVFLSELSDIIRYELFEENDELEKIYKAYQTIQQQKQQQQQPQVKEKEQIQLKEDDEVKSCISLKELEQCTDLEVSSIEKEKEKEEEEDSTLVSIPIEEEVELSLEKDKDKESNSTSEVSKVIVNPIEEEVDLLGFDLFEREKDVNVNKEVEVEDLFLL